jgi:hypothetical protein
MTENPVKRREERSLCFFLVLTACLAWPVAPAAGKALPEPGKGLVTVEASVDPVVFYTGETAGMNLCVTNTNAFADSRKGFLAGDTFLFRLTGCGTFSEVTPGNCTADITLESTAAEPVLPRDFECRVSPDEVMLTYVGDPKPFVFENQFCMTVLLSTPATASCVVEYRFTAGGERQDKDGDENGDEDSDVARAGRGNEKDRIFQPQIPSFFSLDVVDFGRIVDAWRLTGNWGTNPISNFLGTTDNVAFEVRVNNTRALRIEPDPESPNIIGGFSGNSAGAGVVGATIGGGGLNGMENRVFDRFGTVGGGYGNVAGSMDSNPFNGTNATVAGGDYNAAMGMFSSVGGGWRNQARDDGAVVRGGVLNNAGGECATIAGG